MSEPFIGEIRLLAIAWAPKGWALCDGSLLPITPNQALYSLLGTQFGGDGRTTFGLPDLRGRVPLGTVYPGQNQGKQYAGGGETVTLNEAQVPVHNHMLQAIAEAGNKANPADNFYAKVTPVAPATAPVNIYGAATTTVALDTGTLSSVGGGTHDNMQPFLVLNYCIATQGYYPSRP